MDHLLKFLMKCNVMIFHQLRGTEDVSTEMKEIAEDFKQTAENEELGGKGLTYQSKAQGIRILLYMQYTRMSKQLISNDHI